jgi:cytochrome c-type biogenesis protein CcmH
MLIAPCCFSQQVSEHHSEAAERIRADIRVRLAAGESRQEILNAYVQQYGRRVLADPSPEGFGQLLVIVPVLTLALTAVALGLLVRRFARRGAAVHAPAAADGPASVVRRLDDELRDMD